MTPRLWVPAPVAAKWLFVGALLMGGGPSGARMAAAQGAVLLWRPHDLVLEAAADYPWWEFPVRGIFRHDTTGAQVSVEGFWDGGRRWVVRFAPAQPGRWSYRTVSADAGLGERRGQLDIAVPSAADLDRNPNFRGPIRVSPAGRHFVRGDGTPFFLLADTAWAANTARCGLGENEEGPFFQYLADRKAKGFSTILMQYFHGYGDYPDSPGHRNEGGYPFSPRRDVTRLNPEHFRHLDARLLGLWDRGFVAAINATWWGKTKQCRFKPEDAQRIVAYCSVRYGAFNALWSVSGEYQYVFKDCGWQPADITRLGEVAQAHNPWRRPLSVHPSARLDWPAPHNVQSSRPFHGEPWLDHHWLQTGQTLDRLYNIVTRLPENRVLEPAAPVFLSEASYESARDPERAYHARWQVWTAFLNGAAGFGYGADGIWQFYDPADPQGETGKDVKDVVPWREALRQPGSAQLIHARKFLEELEWWRLEPLRQRLRVDGAPNPVPHAKDISPPQCAMIPGRAAVLYLPRANKARRISIELGWRDAAEARWFDPRRGESTGTSIPVPPGQSWTIPTAPQPEEDWVLLVSLSGS